MGTFLLHTLVPAQTAIDGGVAFTNLFLRYESLMITSATWVIVQVLQKGLKVVGENPWFIRFKPGLGVLISVILAYLPSFRLGTWDETLLYGVILGSLTGLGQKILKQTLLGQDYRLNPVIKDPELRKQIDSHLAQKEEEESGNRRRLREKLKNFIA